MMLPKVTTNTLSATFTTATTTFINLCRNTIPITNTLSHYYSQSRYPMQPKEHHRTNHHEHDHYKCSERSLLNLFGKTIIFILIMCNMAIGLHAVPIGPQNGNDIHSVRNIEYKRYCNVSLRDAVKTFCDGRYKPIYTEILDKSIAECCRRPCGYQQFKIYCAEP